MDIQEVSITVEEKVRIHKMAVLVGDQGYVNYKRDVGRFSEYFLKLLNSAGPNGQQTRSLIMKMLSQR